MSTGELTERQAFLALNALPNIGPITLNRLLAELGWQEFVQQGNRGGGAGGKRGQP